MQWRIAVVNQEEKLDQILAGFLELGITGATVIRSEGVGGVRSHDVPIFRRCSRGPGRRTRPC